MGDERDDKERQAALESVAEAALPDLRAARGEVKEVRRALARFFRRGASVGISTGELVDALGVSSPSILSQAGYSDSEADLAMGIVGELSDDEILQEPL